MFGTVAVDLGTSDGGRLFGLREADRGVEERRNVSLVGRETINVQPLADVDNSHEDSTRKRGLLRIGALIVLALIPYVYLGISALVLQAHSAATSNVMGAHSGARGAMGGGGAAGGGGVYSVLTFGLMLAILLSGLSVLVAWLPSKYSDPVERFRFEATRFRGNLVVIGVSHWITLYLCFVSIGRALKPGWMDYGFLALAGIGVLVIVVFAAVHSALKPTQATEPDAETGGGVFPKEWKWGLFYWNPEDPSLFVERRYGYGMTVNFARPMVWVFLIGGLVMVGGVIAMIVIGG